MTLEFYSTLLTLGSIILFALTLVTFCLYFFSKKVKARLEAIDYYEYVYVILVISSFAVAGSLIYQLIYLTPVCELCWWQRIFIYPTVVIALAAYLFKEKYSHITIGILSLFGLFYATYHYYYHFLGFVLGQKVDLPCSVGGLLPACTSSPILIFGFITIPFMAIMELGTIILICILAHKVIKNNYE
jgi:disulfide bond formation protein DsbB